MNYIIALICSIVALIGLSFVGDSLIGTQFNITNCIYFFMGLYACYDLYDYFKKRKRNSSISAKEKTQKALGGIYLLVLFFNLLFI